MPFFPTIYVCVTNLILGDDSVLPVTSSCLMGKSTQLPSYGGVEGRRRLYVCVIERRKESMEEEEGGYGR